MRGIEIITGVSSSNLRGFEILTDPINSNFRGFDIIIKDNFFITVRDLDTNNIVTTAFITLTGSTSDGTYQSGDLSIEQLLPAASIDIDATAPGYTLSSTTVNHGGEDAWQEVTIYIESISTDFSCDIKTETLAGGDLDGNLSSSENTVVKAIFASPGSGTLDPNQYRLLLRQWSAAATGEARTEIELTDKYYDVGLEAIIGTITLTPTQVENIGDSLDARIIGL